MIKNPSILIFLLAALSFVIPTGCQKYEEGPSFSFRSRTARVANTWKVDNYKVNGTDYTSLVAGYTQTFSKDGNYSYTWGSFSGTGKWAFKNNDKEIQISGDNGQASPLLYILKLEEKQFWYYYNDGSDKKEFHMVEK
jgi:hypothetical protein